MFKNTMPEEAPIIQRTRIEDGGLSIVLLLTLMVWNYNETEKICLGIKRA